MGSFTAGIATGPRKVRRLTGNDPPALAVFVWVDECDRITSAVQMEEGKLRA